MALQDSVRNRLKFKHGNGKRVRAGSAFVVQALPPPLISLQWQVVSELPNELQLLTLIALTGRTKL